MSQFGSVEARKLLAALLKLGRRVRREASGSYKALERGGWPDVVCAFHDGVEVGPKMLSRVAKRTGLTPDDL